MSEDGKREFHPELVPRRGEINAWIFSVLTAGGVFVLQTKQNVPGWVWIFLSFLVFSAVSISLGNWIDRRAAIVMEESSIQFENGLRSVRLGWREVQKVAVLPARWGKNVQVIGEKTHFGFKTLGEVQFQGKVRGHTGFAAGDEILNTILKKANLQLVEQKEKEYYYARA
jgi:hypothetical protein